MSDFPKPGDKMRFIAKNGYDRELNAALNVFEPGAVLTVKRCSVGDWSHSIEFEELPIKLWNGVMFERADAPVEAASPIGDQAQPPEHQESDASKIARLERELGEARNRGHRIGSYILSMRDLWDALDRLDAVEARAKSAESRLEAARVALEAFDRTDDEGEFPVAARSGTTVLLLSVPAIAVVKAREALALLNTAPTTTDDAT